MSEGNGKTLLPLNASRLLRDLEKTGLRISALEVANKNVFNPDKVGSDILPWLAWSFSVDSWSDNWSDLVKKETIKRAIILHRTKGTKQAIRQALEIIGVLGEITEWWETSPKMRPHTFNIIAYLNDNIDQNDEVIINLATQKKLINLINNVKPARSHFDFKLGVRFASSLSYGSTARIKQYERFSFISNRISFCSNPLILTNIKVTFYKQIILYG